MRNLFDFKIYLDISDEVKFAWKIQRDMAERGHSLESIKASIEARKPDFNAYVDPQKAFADVVIQVLPTQLIPDDNEGKILRVRMIQKEGKKMFDPVYLFDEGSTISWIPCGRKLTCSYPGIKFFYGPDTYYGEEVSVLEMDGQFDKLEELIYVESHLSNTSAKFCACPRYEYRSLLAPAYARALSRWRGDAADAQVRRLPGLLQRHRPLPDPGGPEDPRPVRADGARRSLAGLLPTRRLRPAPRTDRQHGRRLSAARHLRGIGNGWRWRLLASIWLRACRQLGNSMRRDELYGYH